jgi:hypothetical protein
MKERKRVTIQIGRGRRGRLGRKASRAKRQDGLDIADKVRFN